MALDMKKRIQLNEMHLVDYIPCLFNQNIGLLSKLTINSKSKSIHIGKSMIKASLVQQNAFILQQNAKVLKQYYK